MGKIKEIWKEAIRWTPDDMPETTQAIVVVSNLGKVKRLPHRRWNAHNKSYSDMKEHTYIQGSNRGKQKYDSEEKISKCGLYKHVSINKKLYSVHRLVGKAFLPNPEGKTQINHIDGRRDNNFVSNLEWVTNSENQKHAILSNLKEAKGIGYKMSEEDKEFIISRLNNGVSPKIISELIDGRMSHEGIRIFAKKYCPDYTNIRKKRQRKSDEYYKEKQKEYAENYKLDDTELDNLTSKINDGYTKEDLRLLFKNLNPKLNFLYNKEPEFKKILSENKSIKNQILEPSRGISRKGSKYRYRYGKTYSESHETIEDATESKYQYISILTQNKPYLERLINEHSISSTS